jgi:hypothetical protein
VAEDFDKDGDVDFMAGNYGLNNQFRVSSAHPATLVYKDFNMDGQVDPFFCYYIGQQAFPYASRDEALGQVLFSSRDLQTTLNIRTRRWKQYSKGGIAECYET